jgi:ATP-binding cassette subfamily B (MDR/TAP) protein 1
MQEGIGEKMSIFVYLITTFVFAIIISFINGWKLTLVVVSCAPVIIVAQSVVAKVHISSCKIKFTEQLIRMSGYLD